MAGRTVTLDANEAVAEIAHRTNEVIAIYPITPASPMGEFADQWSFEGRRNIWGADWRPLIAQVFADRCRNRPPGRIAGRFHNALARWAADAVRRTGAEAAVLAGGCFANRLLAERTAEAIRAAGVAVFLPLHVPPGDGGLAAGQLAAAVLAEG
jgi:hydrogenase maturation factor HypF (carbamoyltransferase family)